MPLPLLNFYFFATGMYKVKFPLWIFLMQLTVTAHRSTAIFASFDDCQAI